MNLIEGAVPRIFKSLRWGLLTCSLCLPVVAADNPADRAVSLQQAIALAVQNDAWLQGNVLQQEATEARSKAAEAWADPTVSVSMMNLPVDSWSLQQEAMTQLTMGISQQLPRGESLRIKGQQLSIAASRFPILRSVRKTTLRRDVTLLWLDVYRAQRSVQLIQADSTLFEQMADVARASYASVVGKTRQQDVIRAQLEIVQLQDRLMAQQQQQELALARLNRWLLPDANQTLSQDRHNGLGDVGWSTRYQIAMPGQAVLPSVPNDLPTSWATTQINRDRLVSLLLQHPELQAIALRQQVANKGIALAKEQFRPQWGVNASYGYRDNQELGGSRADLFSLGVSVDLPLFTENKQDKQLAASVAEAESIKTELRLALKKMLSEVEANWGQFRRLQERQALYQNLLLTQTREQAEASLTAYTNDDGDFSQVVSARIAQLNARIAALSIDVDVLKTQARLNYFFQPLATASADAAPAQGE